MKYLSWDEKTIANASDKEITESYENGYVFTRMGKGVMRQTRSVRIRLSAYQPDSENRRILKKVEKVGLQTVVLPMDNYDWKIGKMARDFYSTKFGPDTMSAQKIKEMISDAGKSNFNTLFCFSEENRIRGYAICYKNPSILHYSYPFYSLSDSSRDMGLGMMTLAIDFAKKEGLEYAYLGSLQRPADTYKLQFSGLEWFDGSAWQTDLELAKKLLREQQ